jgi:ribosomal protein S12 methylthiotransferase accessory factor YcaO
VPGAVRGARRPHAARPRPVASLIGEGLGVAFGLSALTGAGAFEMVVAQPAPDDPVLREVTGGCALDPALAQARALGELIERRASLVAADRSVERTHAELGDAAVELAALSAFDDAQHAAEGFSFVRLGADVRARWLPGRRLATGAEVWLPGALVSLDPRFAAPRLGVQSSTGTCAERSRDASVEGALLELVERDVAARCLVTDALLRVDAERFAPGERIAARGLGLDVELALCAVDLPVCVAVAKARHAASGRWSLGLSCKRDPARAFAHAVEEAVQMFHRHVQLGSEPTGGEPSWARLAEAEPDREQLVAFDLRPVIARYDPIACDLTNHESRAVGMWVTAVWSAIAVDLPRPGSPLPLRRWPLGPDLRARALTLARVFA